jgi:hypothetical protein
LAEVRIALEKHRDDQQGLSIVTISFVDREFLELRRGMRQGSEYLKGPQTRYAGATSLMASRRESYRAVKSDFAPA